jgi:cytochrome c
LAGYKTGSAARPSKPLSPPGQSADSALRAKPKNLQVLKGLTRPQLLAVMRSWSEGLVVACNYCHVRQFEAETPRKATARLMERAYVLGLKHKDGRALSCQDCHQGQPNFLRTRPFVGVLGKILPDVRAVADRDRGRLMQLMNEFQLALGVKCAYCHSARGIDLETPPKQITRFMMTEFNRGLVQQDGSAVTCATCHQGHGRLLSVLPFAPVAQRRPAPNQ